MAIFYVSTTGNDANNGSQVSPWKTLNKAFSTVTSGNTIHVNAGTYTQATTLNLPVGVNLEGDGKDTSIIKGTMSGDWSVLLNIESNSLTTGNNTISNIGFDGSYVSNSNFKTWIGIWMTLRHNVVLDNCSIKNFYQRGVIFNGNGDNNSTIPVDPKVYTTGCKITNCVFDNASGWYGTTICGQINVGGTKDMIISGNTMTQLSRPAGTNGEIIKYWGSGYNLGLKILNNTLKRANFSGPSWNGDGDWNFAIELFNQSGMEIAGNDIQGSIDLNYNRVVAPYTYSVHIHDNISNHSPINTKEEQGIIFEFETTNAIVENNKFYNQAMGITFNVRTPNNNGGYNNPMPIGGYSATRDVIVRNNLFVNLYSTPSSSAGIQFLTEGETKDAYCRNLQVYNNTFVTNSSDAAISGIDLSHFQKAVSGTPGADGITIRNNIFVGFAGQYLEGGSAQMVNTVTKDNCTWNNGNSNNPNWVGALLNTNNQKVNPVLDSNYLVPSNSPIYGQNIGYQAISTPQPCTYTYSAWGPCVNGTQTRTVISAVPTGCTGTPILTQSCVIVNQPPVVNAGTDKTLILPINSVPLSGSATDFDGTIASVEWTQISGPAQAAFTPINAVSTTVSNLVQGTYIFRLIATDNLGLTAFDEATVVVNPQPVNQNPIANAGPDVTITLPINSVTLNGSATDSDGSIVGYTWKNNGGVTVGTTASITISNLTEGIYTYTLTVTDNQGATGSDSVQVTVKAAPTNQNSTKVIVYEYANNTAAKAAGLTVGMLYRTGSAVKVVI